MTHPEDEYYESQGRPGAGADPNVREKAKLTAHDYEFHYRHDGDTVRLWKPHWAGDQFEVLPRQAFDTFQNTGSKVGLIFVEADD